MRRKDSSVHLLLSTDAAEALAICATVYQRFGLSGVITSAKDGKHSENSKHYWKPDDPRPADAFDLRLPSRCFLQGEWDFRVSPMDRAVCNEIRQALGDDYDVILESSEVPWHAHIHVEYDPKDMA